MLVTPDVVTKIEGSAGIGRAGEDGGEKLGHVLVQLLEIFSIVVVHPWLPQLEHS